LSSRLPPASGDDLITVLAERSPVGVFDLNFKAGVFYYSTAWKKQLVMLITN